MSRFTKIRPVDEFDVSKSMVAGNHHAVVRFSDHGLQYGLVRRLIAMSVIMFSLFFANTVFSQFTGDVSGTEVRCIADGTITIDNASTTSVYFIQSSGYPPSSSGPGSGSYTFSDLPKGTYTVTEIKTSNEQFTQQVILDGNYEQNWQLTATSWYANCEDGVPGNIIIGDFQILDADLDEMRPPYTFRLSAPNGSLPADGSGSPAFEDVDHYELPLSVAGSNFQLQARDSCDNFKTFNLYIPEDQSALNLNINRSAPINCDGDMEVTLNSTSGTAPFLYTIISSTQTGDPLVGTTSTDNPTVWTFDGGTTYRVAVRDECGATDTVDIAIPNYSPTISVNNTFTNWLNCNGDRTYTITANGGFEPYTFEILSSTPADNEMVGSTSMTNPTEWTLSGGTSYSMRVTDACGFERTFTINVPTYNPGQCMTVGGGTGICGDGDDNGYGQVNVTLCRNGFGPYTLEIESVDGSGCDYYREVTNLSTNSFLFDSLPRPCSYIITLTDACGVTVSRSFEFHDPEEANLSCTPSIICPTSSSELVRFRVLVANTPPYTPTLPISITIRNSGGDIVSGYPQNMTEESGRRHTADLPAGEYTYEVTDACGVSCSGAMTMPSYANPDVYIDTDQQCYGSGQITLVGVNSNEMSDSAYIFSIVSGPTDVGKQGEAGYPDSLGVFSNLQSDGIYTFRFNDGCKNVEIQAAIPTWTQPTFEVGFGVICEDGLTADLQILNLQPDNIARPYHWLITHTTSDIYTEDLPYPDVSGQTDSIFYDLPARNDGSTAIYTILGYDNCKNSYQAVGAVGSFPDNSLVLGQTTICPGEESSVSIRVQIPIVGAVYEFYRDEELFLTTNDYFNTISPAVPGAYRAVIRYYTSEDEYCEYETESVVLSAYGELIVTNPEPVCPGEPVDLTAAEITAGSTGGTFSYYEDAALTIPVADPTNVVVPGTYYIKMVTDGPVECEISAPVEVINENCCPEIYIQAAIVVDAVCGEETASVTVIATGSEDGYIYRWENEDGDILSTSDVLSNVGPGVYTVYVSADLDGCDAETMYAIAVGTLQGPQIQGVVVPEVCMEEDGSIEITITGGVPAYSILWSNGSTETTVTDLSAGSYSVTVTDREGCSEVALFEVERESGDLTVVVETVVDADCNSSNGSITVSADGSVEPVTYLWSNGETGTEITDLAPGSYTVTVTDGNGCSIAETVFVSNIGGPSDIEVTVESNVGCKGDNTGSISISSDGEYTYRVFNHEGLYVGQGNSVEGLVAGSYYVEARDVDGCRSYIPFDISEPADVLDLIITNIVESDCEGSTIGSITVRAEGGTAPYEFLWTGDEGYTGEGEIIENLTSGTYTVTMTDDNGCELVASVEVGENGGYAPDLEDCEIDELTMTIECNGDLESQINEWNQNNIDYLSGCANSVVDYTVTSSLDMEDFLEDCSTTTGEITVQYTLTTVCGHESYASATLTIEDTTAPDLSDCGSRDETIECANEDNEENAEAWHLDNIGYLLDCAYDACTDTLSVTSDYSWENYDSSCGNTGSITVTYQVTDDCGNISEEFVATLTIEDTTAPDISDCESQDLTIECANDVNEVNAEAWHLANIEYLKGCATDDCNEGIEFIINSDYSWENYDVTCGNSGTLTVTYTVEDDCGNISDEFVAVLTIEDTTAPDITNCETEGQNLTIECANEDNEANAEAWHLDNIEYLKGCATDECNEGIEFEVTSDYSWENYDESCGNTGTLTVTYQVVDDCGNISEDYVAVLTIEDTTAPDIADCESQDLTIECAFDENEANAEAWHLDNIEYLKGCATDACNDGIEFVVTSDYDWSNYDESCGNTGTLTVTYQVVDDCRNISVDFVAVLTIEDTTAPDISNCESQDLTIECANDENEANAYAWHLENIEYLKGCATDACNDGIEFVITSDYDWSNYEESCGNTGTLTVTYQVVDDCGNISEDFVAVLTIEDTTAPDISDCESQDLTIECVASENEANAYAWHLANIEYLKGCATDDCNDGYEFIINTDYSWSNYDESCGNTGTLTVTYTVEDDCGNVSEEYVTTLTIVDTTAPDISDCESQDLTIECEASQNEANAYAWHLENIEYLKDCATDECNDGYEFVIQTNYDWSNYNVICGTAGTLTVTYQVVDDCGNVSADYVTTLTIEDTTAPEIEIVDPVFAGVENGGIVEVECYAADPDWEYPVLRRGGVEVYDDCSSVEFTIQETFSNNGDCKTDGYLSQHFYLVTAIDDCQNVTTLEFEMRVVDKTAPVIVGVPADVTVSCNNIPVPSIGGCNSSEPAEIYAVDECECATLEFEEIVSNKTCDYNFDILRRWTATDNCGNVTVEEQRIYVRDQSGPEFIFHEPELKNIPNGSTYYHECNNDGDFPEWSRYLNGNIITATDGCSGEATVSFRKHEERTERYCENGVMEKWTYEWRAADLCGNESIYSFSIAIVDRTGPQLIGESVVCTDAESGYPVAIDACSDVSNLFFDDRKIKDECGREVIERTWVAYDLCNNESVFVQTILLGNSGIDFYVQEGLLPAGFVSGDMIKIACGEEYRMEPFRRNGAVSGDSDCIENVNLKFKDIVVNNKECEDGISRIHRYIWTGVDECGNESEFVVNFGIIDTRPPYFFNNPTSLQLSCRDAIPAVNVADGCSEVTLVLVKQDTVYASGVCAMNYAIDQVYEAVDACGNKATFERHITFADEDAPVFIDPQYTGCISEIAVPLVVDGCDGVVDTLEYVDSQMLNDDCGIYDYIERRWVASDACGNVSEITQKLLVSYDFDLIQIRNPQLGALELGKQYTLDCNDYTGDVSDFFTVNDIVNYSDCGLLDAGVRVELVTSYDCTGNGGILGRYKVSYSLRLPCENVFEYYVFVDLKDTEAPVFTYAPEDKYLGCYNPDLFETPVIEEGCSEYSLEYKEEVVEKNYEGQAVTYVYRTWIATDLCGNVSSHTQLITIREYDNNAEIILLNTPHCNSKNNMATIHVDHFAHDLKFEWKVISGDCVITSGQDSQTITYFIGFSPVRLRVTITDRDGCVIVREISFTCDRINLDGGPRAIAEDFNGEEEILLYPNPTRYNLYLEWEAKRDEVVKIRVISVAGVMTKDVKVNQKKGYNKLEIDVQDLTSGVYILELEEEYQTRHAKFVKIE